MKENDEKRVENKNIDKKSKKNPKKRNKIIGRILIIILLGIIAFCSWFLYKMNKNGGGLSGAIATVVGHDEFTKENLDEFQVLILGVSTGIDAKLSDTIMIASYNPKTQKASLVSIPRDTFVGTNSNYATANDKINAIYSYTQDPEAMLEEVNDITGLDIQNYIVIDTDALVEVVDTIGGVYFDVPIDMDYDDSTQDLYIHVDAGYQLLDGDLAEQVVRFRHNNDGTTYSDEYGDNDTGRMKTQQAFIEACLSQFMTPSNIFNLSTFLEIFENNVTTNITLDTMLDYLPYAVEFSVSDLQTGTLPGTNTNNNTSGVWVYLLDDDGVEEMITEMFIERDITYSEDDITIEIIDATSGDEELIEEYIDTLEYARIFCSIN